MRDALAAAAGRDVSHETFARISAYAELLKAEASAQNLIARSTLDALWERHILDSAQLARFEPFAGSSWVDVGSGAGLPGIIIAALVEGPITLVEPRRLRAEFLQRTVDQLGIAPRVTVAATKVERITGKFDVITGRAVAALERFLDLSHHLSTQNSIWALPKGRNAKSELADAQQRWQGVFHVERSVTDDDSYIVVGTGVREKL
jgi:16S rRNA (guanine527-N7)-methyltransferase